MPDRLRVDNLSFFSVTQGEETHVRPSFGAGDSVFAPVGEDLVGGLRFCLFPDKKWEISLRQSDDLESLATNKVHVERIGSAEKSRKRWTSLQPLFLPTI